MSDLSRHVGPGFESLRAFELTALTFEILGHAIEVVDQAAELVGSGRDDTRIEIPARNPSRRPREPIDRIGDPLGHRIAQCGAEQAEQDRRREHQPPQVVDLPLDFSLAEGHRHRHDAFA